MCRVLGVCTSRYYAWQDRGPSTCSKEDAELRARIEGVHRGSRGTYGVPRVHAALRAEGTRVGRKRVARLMRQAGLEGVSRRKKGWTTRRDREARPAPDLVERDFASQGADRLWVADIERHEALWPCPDPVDTPVMLVAASAQKLRAA